MDRRGADRCPVCQGPTRTLEGGELRCRNSLCAFNHRTVSCPRCKHVGPQVFRSENNILQLDCKECQHRWSIPAS